MSVHAHSTQAYRDGKPTLDARKREIYEAFAWLGVGTDRECLERLHQTDMNYVRPRITELIKEGILEEAGECEDHLTGRMVRRVRIAQNLTGSSATMLINDDPQKPTTRRGPVDDQPSLF